jgi:glycosyltransferase involved in cell wall biosynthesis
MQHSGESVRVPERPRSGARGVAVLVVAREADAGALERTLGGIREQATGTVAAVELADLAQGYARALGDFANRFPDHDIVCMRAGVELPFAWDARLAKAAHASEDIAAAVSLCDVSPLHALADPERRAAAAAAWSLVDRTAYCMGARAYYEVPVLHPVCAYLRRDALGELAGLESGDADDAGTLNLLARRWKARGRLAVVCDYLYVGYDGSAIAGAPQADATEAAAFAMHNPLGALRRGVNEALPAGLPPVSTPALDARPVQLHIMHFWGGGLDKWVRDFGRADSARTNLILATYRIGELGGQRVVLYSDPDAKVPIRTWDMARPLRSTAVSSIEYAAILRQVIREFQVEALVVSSLIGHTLDALRQPLPTILVTHDFYPVCQSINPRLDGGCDCRPEDLGDCGKANPHYVTLGSPSAAEWTALRDAYVGIILERRLEMVVPSPSVEAAMKRLEPRLADLQMRVIPHGIEMIGEKRPAAALDPSGRLRLVVVGRLVENKGAELLKAAAPELAALADITLVGCGPHAMALARECGWIAIEEYRNEELPAILARIHPHAGILASVVPETFSYTLSELRALGIPPVATALGSFVDRIDDGVDGFLFEPNAAALVRTVRMLAAQPARLAQVAEAVALLPVRTTADMISDYDPLLPQGARPVARFEVGIGTDTALTEPYRHLQGAYAHLQGAYQQVAGAYAQTNAAYTVVNDEYRRVSGELDRLRTLCDRYSRELESLRVGLLWWRAPEAGRLVVELRQKMHAPAGARADETKEPKT